MVWFIFNVICYPVVRPREGFVNEFGIDGILGETKITDVQKLRERVAEE